MEAHYLKRKVILIEGLPTGVIVLIDRLANRPGDRNPLQRRNSLELFGLVIVPEPELSKGTLLRPELM